MDRGGELVFLAPHDCSEQAMQRFIKERRFWIYTKLAEKEKLGVPRSKKEFASGEPFHYLGRTYRLRLTENASGGVRLVRGRFELQRDDAGRGPTIFREWYAEHASGWLVNRVPPWAERMRLRPSTIRVSDLKNRWASCGSDEGLNFHWATIQLPPSIIDYVIVHELAHLAEKNHVPEFWLRVERAMPDFAARKQWLAENGAEFARV